MPKVDFYILDIDAKTDAGRFACRLTEKAYHTGLKIFICTASEQQAQKLDELLWTFKQGSFLPHERIENTPTQSNSLPIPILIGNHLDENQPRDILINLKAQLPEYPERFQRIAELVYNDNEEKQAARERFRYYRDQGYEVNSHEIRI